MRKLILILLCALAYGQTANQQCTKEQDQQTLSTSGNTLTFLDSCGTQTNSFELVISGAPSTFTATISGVMRGGTTVTLTTTSATTANQLLNTANGPYDKYTFTATWTGGTSPSVLVNRTAATARHYVPTTIDLSKLPVPGIDQGVMFNNACNSLPSNGGTLDARGLASPIFWDSNPFAGTYCPGLPSVTILLNAQSICYSVPIVTPAGATITFVGAASYGGGSNFVPNNPSGVDAAFCPGGSAHPTFSSTPNAAIGGLFVTSWVGGQNGLITFASASSSGTTITFTTSGPVAYPANYVVGATGFVTGSGNGKLDGTATIASVNNVTGVMTVTTSNTVGATVGNILTAGPNVTFALDNAVVGYFDGSLNSSAGFGNGYQWCDNNSFAGSVQNVAFYGNGIPNFVAYYTCAKQENNILSSVTVTHHSLAAIVRDASFTAPGNAAPTHSSEQFLVLDPGTTTANQSVTQASSTFTNFTITAGASATYNYATMTWSTALNATPVTKSTVYISGTGTGADGHYFQVTDASSGLSGCSNPSTTSLCILTPGIAAHAAVAVGTVTLMTVGEMYEGFEIPNTGAPTASGNVVAGLWVSQFGTTTGGRSGSGSGLNRTYMNMWVGSVKNGSVIERWHNEAQYVDSFEFGMGSNTIAAWGCTTCETGSTSLASLQFTNGITVLNDEYGGGESFAGPGSGINVPSVVRFGQYAFANSTWNVCNVYSKNLVVDVRNNYFQSVPASNSNPEKNCSGSYNQGTQYSPACYVSGASPACAGAAAGVSTIAAAGTSVTVSTTAVTANSIIDVYVITASVGGLTCNAVTNPTALLPYVSAIVANTSFTITSVAPAGGTACYGWSIQN
jgi:hypothetical protein